MKNISQLELIEEAKKQVKELAAASKSLWQNKSVNLCFIQRDDETLGLSKIQVGWHTKNPCIIIGNKPMTQKQVLDILETAERFEKQQVKIEP